MSKLELDLKVSKLLRDIKKHYNGNIPPYGTKGSELYNSVITAYIMYSNNPEEYSRVLSELVRVFEAAEGLLALGNV